MSELITNITHQPHFPHEDLRVNNALTLELLLQNREQLERDRAA